MFCSRPCKFQFIAPSSLPYKGRWPGERRVGGVKAYQFCGVKSSLSPLSRLRRQLPSKGSLGNDKSQLALHLLAEEGGGSLGQLLLRLGQRRVTLAQQQHHAAHQVALGQNGGCHAQVVFFRAFRGGLA